MDGSLLTPKQVSEATGIAVQTLARWRVEGLPPKFTKLGSAVRYFSADVAAWMLANRRSSTSEKPAGESGAK